MSNIILPIRALAGSLAAIAIVCFLLAPISVDAKKKSGGGDSRVVSLTEQAKIKMDEAEDIAFESVPGRTRRIELEKKDGRLVYEIIICQGRVKKEVQVDANSGKVIEIDKKFGKCDD